ncbi:MAG TPA: LysM domain-containing protein [Drouetiella sp.]
MASDKPDSIERAPARDNTVWIHELMDGGAIQKRYNSALSDALGFPQLATDHLVGQAPEKNATPQDSPAVDAKGQDLPSPDERVSGKVLGKAGVGEQDQRSPDERVTGKVSGNAGIGDQDQRPPDERVRGRDDSGWDPYESLQPGDNDLSKFLSQVSDYRGAEIHLKVEPSTYTAKPGESLERIAEKHLGPHATKEQIEQHADEIARYNQISRTKNGLPGTHVLQAGEQLRLPGHDKDGSTVFTDSQHSRFTYSTDGKTKVEFKDGTSYTRTPDAEGGHTDVHNGPKPEDHFEVKVKNDGSVEKSTQSQDVTPDLSVEREKLDHLADSKIGLTKERAQFKDDMAAFEKRAREQHLSAEEVAKTYHQVSRVLDATGTHPIDDRKRTRVALGIMAVAAEPTSNDQGCHNTCNVTVIENRLFTREPSSAAKLIADVATTGKYVGADGTTVNLDRESFATHGEEAMNAPRGTNVRNYASQLFDVTAVNLILVKHNEATIPPGDLRYSQERANGFKDSGERVRDFSTNPPKVVGDDPTEAGLFNGMIDINSMITGRFEPDAFLSHKDSITPLDSSVTSFDTQEDFEAKLAAAKKSGSFPIVLGVHANNSPFFDEADQRRPLHADQALQDGHVVLVTGYDPVKHTVTYDNQWGNSQDHSDDRPVSVADMYNATKRMSATAWLDRIEHRHSQMTEKQYASDIESVVKDYANYWSLQKKGYLGGSVDEQEQSAAHEKVDAMLASISSARANLVRKHLKDVWAHMNDQPPVANAIVPPMNN